LADTRKSFEAKLTEVEQQISAEQETRKQLIHSLPTELVDLYEKIRADRGDVGAALLTRGACQGCHLSLDATEINRIKELPEDTIVRCEECRRILVRTKG
jgi:predicted  nucleic acid-binding Zn-ribbon protein